MTSPPAPSGPLLVIDHMGMRFGGLTALDDISFTAADGAITAVIGPNGAGKTTLFNCLTGFYRPTSGHIHLNHGGRAWDLGHMPPHRIARDARLARTFQNIRLFGRMSVLENLLVAQHRQLMQGSMGGLAGLLGLPVYLRAQARAMDVARFWLDRMGLTALADAPAASLPYGAQRRLEIARALCTEPRLLCLDEPAAGLNPRESGELAALLVDIRDQQHLGILLIEHDMSVVMSISDHVVVLDYGRRIAEGAPTVVRASPAVIKAYLGEDDDEDLPPTIATDAGLGGPLS